MQIASRQMFYTVSLVVTFALSLLQADLLGRKPPIRAPDEYLLGVGNNEEDQSVDVYIFSTAAQEKYFKTTLKNTQLSPACGKDYHLCKDLIVVEGSLDSSLTSLEVVKPIVAFVPVRNGLVLVEFRWNGLWQYKTSIPANCSCDPITLYRHTHGNTIHLVCRRVEDKLTSMIFYEAQLGDPVSLKFLNSIPFPHLELSELSNFEYVSLGTESDLQGVYFGVSSSLYVFNPTELDYQPDIGDIGNCSAVESLVYARNWALYAYCHSGSVVCFDLQTFTWVNQTNPNKRTYRCPNGDVYLDVYPRKKPPFMKYHVWSTNQEKQFALQGKNYDVGRCFGMVNHTFFAYTDREKGSFVVDTLLPNSEASFKVSSNNCPETGCKPLSVFEERYVVVLDGGANSAVHVADCINSCVEIINVEHVSVDLVAMVHVQSDDEMGTLVPTGKMESGNNEIVWKPAVVVAVTIGAVLVLIVLTVTSYLVCKRRRSRPGPIQPRSESMELLLLHDPERSSITSSKEQDRDTRSLTKSCTQSASSILLPDGNSGTLIGTKSTSLRPTTLAKGPPIPQQTPRLLCAENPTNSHPVTHPSQPHVSTRDQQSPVTDHSDTEPPILQQTPRLLCTESPTDPHPVSHPGQPHVPTREQQSTTTDHLDKEPPILQQTPRLLCAESPTKPMETKPHPVLHPSQPHVPTREQQSRTTDHSDKGPPIPQQTPRLLCAENPMNSHPVARPSQTHVPTREQQSTTTDHSDKEPPILQQTPCLLCAESPTKPHPVACPSHHHVPTRDQQSPTTDHWDVTNSECHELADVTPSPTSVVHGRERPVPHHIIHGRDLIVKHPENVVNDLRKMMNQIADCDPDNSNNDSSDNS